MNQKPDNLFRQHRKAAALRRFAEANEELSVVQVRDYQTSTKKNLAQKAWNARMAAIKELRDIDTE